MTFTLSHELLQPVKWQWDPVTAGTRLDGPFVLGLPVTFAVDTRIKGLGWARSTSQSRLAGVFSNAGTQLAAVAITWNGLVGGVLPAGTVAPTFGFVSPITCYANTTYWFVFQVFATEGWSNQRTITPSAPYPIIGSPVQAKYTGSSTFAMPTISTTGTLGQCWGDLIIDMEYSTYETHIEPPEPVIVPAANAFNVILPKEWMPDNLVEWDLQYSISKDNTSFGGWIDLGTFRAIPVADDPGDADTDPDVSGSFNHISTETLQPMPYYRYRYKLRTPYAESDWSEIAYAGQVRFIADSAESVEPGAVGAGDIQNNAVVAGNIGNQAVLAGNIALNAITAGTIAAGSIQAGALQAGAVTAGTIASGAITAGTINAGAVTVGTLAAGVVDAQSVQANAITAGAIAANAVTAGTIAASAVTTTTLAADAVVAGKIAADAITTREILAGSIQGSDIQALTITAGLIQTGAIQAGHLAANTVTAGTIAAGAINAANLIVDGLINGVKIADGAINGVKLADGAVVAGKVSANAIQAGNIAANAVTAGTLAAGAINASTILADGIVVAGKLAAASINANNLFVDGVINGTKIQDGSVNGVKLLDGTVDAVKVIAGTITSRQVAADLLDANLSQAAYLDASAISGGNLTLGGTRTYSNNFDSSSGDLSNPWTVTGSGKTFATYPFGPTPGTQRYAVTWAQTLRIDLVAGAVIPAGELLTFLYSKPTNRVTKMSFHIKQVLPTTPSAALRSELVDNNGALRPSNAVWSNTGTYETTGGTAATETFNVAIDPLGLAGGVGFSLRNNSGSSYTVPAGTWYMEVSIAAFEYEKGYGTLSIFDAQNRLRSEMTSNYISMRKVVDAVTTQEVFRADSLGVWVPLDGFTIGSTKINNLSYSQRDLSGGLMINPRFESLRTTDPAKILPSDWTYLPDQTRFGYTEGILPQVQSLVSGRALTMTLPSSWTSGSSRTIAVSHKRYIQADSTMPIAPITVSAYMRCPAGDPDLQGKITVYASSSSSDIGLITDLANDTKLGEATIDGTAVGAMTVDNQLLFQRVARSYSQATGAAGDTMAVNTTAGSYIYVTLEVYVKSGRPALSTPRLVEWDNVDLALAEQPTPSDNQAIADLTRKVTDLQTLAQYKESGTKSVLAELGTGIQGLDMVAVN